MSWRGSFDVKLTSRKSGQASHCWEEQVTGDRLHHSQKHLGLPQVKRRSLRQSTREALIATYLHWPCLQFRPSGKAGENSWGHSCKENHPFVLVIGEDRTVPSAAAEIMIATVAVTLRTSLSARSFLFECEIYYHRGLHTTSAYS